MDGYETCRQLKAKPETSGIPVIFITASDTSSDEALGLSLGAIDYITKPFVEAIVRARVRNHLALVQATAELRRANAELQRLSVTDPLTGVANRRRLMEAGEDDLSRARRAGLPVSVLMLDLDHFKQINDTFGHGAGDEVIKAFSRVCRETVRTIDIVGRLGGEEFAIVLPQTAHAGARLLAERIRERTEQLSVATESGVTIRFTVSIGVAEASDARLSRHAGGR
jgi:diguanylate cyclase (GGDEF)-like protein